MRALVIGAGEVGKNIAWHLVQEEQDVVVVDSDTERLRALSESLDVQIVEGMGSYPDVLEAAGANGADMIIAVTDSDEVNMVACQMAYSLFQIPRKIARVRHRSYLGVTRRGVYTPENMPVDVIISPELEVADAILRTMTIPGSFDASFFADERFAAVGARVVEHNTIANIPFRTLKNTMALPFLPVALYRDGRILVPAGSDHIELGDELFFMCPREHVSASMEFLGHTAKDNRNVMVVGGGNVGFDIARRLELMGINCRIVDHNRARAGFLAEKLGSTIVLHGNALDKDLLMQENAGAMDAVICATSNDPVNVLCSVLSTQLGAKNVITLVNQPAFIELGTSLGLDKMISPREITASRILQLVRRGEILALHAIHDDQAEFIEIQVNSACSLNGLRLGEARLPKEVLVTGLLRTDGTAEMPTAGTVVHNGDRLILFSTASQIHSVENLL